MMSVLRAFFVTLLLWTDASLASAESNCEMTIWAFDSMDQCIRSLWSCDKPSAIGTIVADGQCRTVVTNTSSTSSEYELLPGTYRAEWRINQGVVSFTDSGCTDDTCSSTETPPDDDMCDHDSTKASSLYTVGGGSWEVEDPADAKWYRRWRLGCAQTEMQGLQLTLIIFGDCSAPGCNVKHVLPSSSVTLK